MITQAKRKQASYSTMTYVRAMICRTAGTASQKQSAKPKKKKTSMGLDLLISLAFPRVRPVWVPSTVRAGKRATLS